MEKSSILSADILDILFEGRNKSYGAYELRKTYDRRITYALAGTFFLCLFFIVGSILANGKKKNEKVELATTVILEAFKDKPEPEIPKPIPKEEPKVAMVKDYVPKIMPDELVKEDDEVKPVEEIENVKIGNVNTAGDKIDDIVALPVEAKGIGVEEPHVKKDIDDVVAIVQVQAQFPGGIGEWTRFLERNLNKELPAENGAPPADYTVIVSFIVDREGNVSDVKAENDPGYGVQTEAVRVIKKGPKWIPAMQNGRNVVYRQKQKITFRVGAE